MKHDLRGAVVVITGASAGIGRASALRFSEQGSKVVLAARRGDALDELARECEQRGCSALAVPTDVTDEGQVEALARKAVERFGKIDVWVNNAAVSAFGRFEETPPDVFRRVMETNFFGYVHGARAALRCFREQGHGTLINVSSVVGVVGQPYTSAYTASKWAIRGFSEALRGELSLDEAKDIQVCTVLPAAIDTPLFQAAANFSGRAARALDPTYDASVVADRIVSLARRPRREVYAGMFGRLAAIEHTLMPGLVEKVFARQVDQKHFQPKAQEPTRGNLYEPLRDWATISGGWTDSNSRNGSHNGRSKAPSMAPGIAVLAGAGALTWWGLNRRRKARTPRARAGRMLHRAGDRLPIGR